MISWFCVLWLLIGYLVLTGQMEDWGEISIGWKSINAILVIVFGPLLAAASLVQQLIDTIGDSFDKEGRV